MTEIQPHPTLDGILVRSDGWIFLPSTRGHTAHWTKGSKNKDNYYRIKYKQHILYVHRLVAETFIPNPDNKPEVDHINTDRCDNDVNNLRWVTRKENHNNPITKEHHKGKKDGRDCRKTTSRYFVNNYDYYI